MLGGTARSFEKGGRPADMFVCSFEGMPVCSGSLEARLLERGQLVMRVRHHVRRDWFVWWGRPAQTVELLGAFLGDCRGIGWVSFRVCFVSRSLFYLVSRVAPLDRRAFRLANALRLLLLSRRTWNLPREHVL